MKITFFEKKSCRKIILNITALFSCVVIFNTDHAYADPLNTRSLPYDDTPRIGILVPIGPPDYGVLLDALEDAKTVKDGPFTYQVGKMSNVPVVLIIQHSDGNVMRALGAQQMLQDFNVRAVIYPGTSGAHLDPQDMSIGDIVLGAKTVNHSNYYLSPAGEIQPGAFDAFQPGMKHYRSFFADPKILAMMACSAHRVAQQTSLPAWFQSSAPDKEPRVFYYGVQGSSTIWSDNRDYIHRTRKVFGEIDEAGDWESGLVATIWKVPYIEVNIISNSILAFPDKSHGTPEHPQGEIDSHVFAQRMSNRITLDLIAHYGKRILGGMFTVPETSPFPDAFFETPTDPKGLLSRCAQ